MALQCTRSNISETIAFLLIIFIIVKKIVCFKEIKLFKIYETIIVFIWRVHSK